MTREEKWINGMKKLRRVYDIDINKWGVQ